MIHKRINKQKWYTNGIHENILFCLLIGHWFAINQNKFNKNKAFQNPVILPYKLLRIGKACLTKKKKINKIL